MKIACRFTPTYWMVGVAVDRYKIYNRRFWTVFVSLPMLLVRVEFH